MSGYSLAAISNLNVTWGRFGSPTAIHLASAGQQAPKVSWDPFDTGFLTEPHIFQIKTGVAKEIVPVLEGLIAEARGRRGMPEAKRAAPPPGGDAPPQLVEDGRQVQWFHGVKYVLSADGTEWLLPDGERPTRTIDGIDYVLSDEGNKWELPEGAPRTRTINGVDCVLSEDGTVWAPVETTDSAPTEHAESAPSAGGDVLDEIRRLGELRDGGLLTSDEFEAKKTELLQRL